MGGFQNVLPSLSPEPISGNSLTQYLRSLTNYGGAQANNYLNAGPGIMASGFGTTGTGLGQVNTGIDAASAGFNQLKNAYQTTQPAQNYWQNILSGDPTATAAALGPTANNLSQIYSGALQGTSTGTPLGGYRSVSMAQLPQAQASQVGNYLLGLQPTAAQNLNTIAGTQAGIGAGTVGAGSTIGNLGLGVGGIGLGTSGLGLGTSQLGGSLLNSTLNSILGERGQDIGQQSSLTSGLLGLGGQALGGWLSGLSDIMAKEGIIPLGDYHGLPVYIFRYKGDDQVRMGVIAQEVREMVPEAVSERSDGLLMVDYEYLFRRLEEV